MSQIVKVMMVAALSMTLLVQNTQAQEDAEAAQVTQAELAQMLVNITGMARFLPSPASPQQMFAALMANGIVPEDGWIATAVVTKATLARVVVQAMNMAAQVEDPSDPNSWVALLQELGIPIDSVGEAVQNVGPDAQPVSNFVLGPGTSTDPLVKQTVFGLPDEKQFGTDLTAAAQPGSAAAQTIEAIVGAPVTDEQIRDVISSIPTPRPPVTPPTPDGGEGS